MTQLTHRHDPGSVGRLMLDRDSHRLAVMARLSDLYQLTKLRITVMVAMTASVGFALGVRAAPLRGLEASAWSWWQLLATVVGTAMSCMGASALNQVCEADADAKMHRTKDRPLPAERISAASATVLGLALGVGGVATLAVLTNPFAAGLSAFTLLSYILIYTPLKRVSSVSTIVGAVPGALPPVIGYAAATGAIGVEAVIVFAIMFLWQLPHFLAIAWLYRDDFARAAFPMLPVLDPTGGSTFRQILLGCMALVPLGLLPAVVGFAGKGYFFGALLAGVAFLGFGVALVIGRTRGHARALFIASLVYLPLVLALMVVDGA